MKRLQGVSGIGALVWLRGMALLAAVCVTAGTGLAQSVRLVPSTTRFAGDGSSGATSDQGTANTIPLNAPTYAAADLSGNVYISDTGNNCIRRVDATGYMTVAVGQPAGASDTCQNASSVTSTYTTGVLKPSGLAVNPAGNLFVADTGHNCVRRLPGGGGIAALQPLIGDCTQSSLTSPAPSPAGVALDAAGNLYIAVNDTADGIYQVIRSSAPAYSSVCLMSGAASAAVSTQCSGVTGGIALKAPQGLAIDPVGNLYIADSGNACVREISGGVPTTAIGKCANDGTSSNSTTLQTPVSITSDAVGHLYVTDNAAGQVFELLGNQLKLVAGTGGTGIYAPIQEGKAAIAYSLLNPQGLAADKAGNVYVADTNNNIVRDLTQGLLFPETSVGNHSAGQTLWFVITSAVKLASGPQGDFQTFGGNTCSGTISAPAPGELKTCQMALRFVPTLPGLRTGPLIVTDSSTSPATNYRFGMSGVGQSAEAIFIPGTIKSLAKSLATPSAIAIDSAGDVFYAEADGGNGSISVLPAGSTTPTVLVPPGGGVANPKALALDATGNLYIADAATNSILRYDVNGNLSNFVTGLDNPVALVADELGNLYVAQDGTTSVNVLEIYAGGQKAILAGGGSTAGADDVPATSEKFIHPSALYLDPGGTMYVGDAGAYLVYQIDTTGMIHRFAGTGTTSSTDTTKRLGTALPGIAGISSDPGGDIYIADAATNRIYVAFSGLAQNPSIAVLAGTGTAAYTGDNGPANAAELNNPMAVAVDGAADVYIADTGNDALREITYKDPTLDFGTVKVGQTAGPLATTLWNTGNDTLQPLANAILDDTVNFSIDDAGSGCGNSISSGATCNLSFFFNPKGPGSFVGHYKLTDSSVVQTQIVTLLGNAPPPPVTTIASSAVTVVYGDAYTLAAVITGNQPDAPTGTATFSIGGTALCPAESLPSTGAVSCSPSPTLEDVGTYTVTISYSGDSNYPAATSTIKLIVTPRPVTITVDDKTRPVNTANPPLTGTVANVVPGQSITATYSTTATISSPAGTYPITAAYAFGPGTKPSNYTVTVINGTLTITTTDDGGNPPGGGGGNPPGGGGSFSLTATPPEQEIDHQGTVNYVVSLKSTGGFTGPVSLACSGLPEGASCAFAPAAVTLASGATGSSTMTITATADTTNVPTVFGSLRTAPPQPAGSVSPLLGWTLLPLGLFGSGGILAGARRRRRLWLLLVPFALLLAAGISGCAAPSNYKIYTVTITGSATSGGATTTQSATVDFVLAR